MASAADKFSELEQRILRAVDVIKSTRAEKEIAQKQLAVAHSQIERLERERDLIRDKVESLLEMLSEITEESHVWSETSKD